jgi:hypothetical protein
MKPFDTPQQWLDAEREVAVIRMAIISMIRKMSVNPTQTEALVQWIEKEPCEPTNSVCGFDLPPDETSSKARVRVVAGAWIAAGKPGL